VAAKRWAAAIGVEETYTETTIGLRGRSIVEDTAKIGIIICDRYRDCAGGKCFRAALKREGAFSVYADRELEIVGYTTCGGCPGGNVEYAPAEMKKNGAAAIHFATGLLVGYPPCPYVRYFKDYVEEAFGLDVVLGTHPIPEKYLQLHGRLGTWDTPEWQDMIRSTLVDEATRRAYD
jgi:predicted metal-binding protein